MIEVKVSETFDKWLKGLRDRQGRARIVDRIERLAGGNFGDCKPIGGGLSELRLNFGPGYRIYYRQDADTLVILLCGGDKASQSRDIRKARKIADDWSST